MDGSRVVPEITPTRVARSSQPYREVIFFMLRKPPLPAPIAGGVFLVCGGGGVIMQDYEYCDCELNIKAV